MKDSVRINVLYGMAVTHPEMCARYIDSQRGLYQPPAPPAEKHCACAYCGRKRLVADLMKCESCGAPPRMAEDAITSAERAGAISEIQKTLTNLGMWK